MARPVAVMPCTRLAYSHHSPSFLRTRRILTINCENNGKKKPAREVAIDFGKYYGRKLGTLPVSYLKWIERSAYKDWVPLVQQVLADPLYNPNNTSSSLDSDIDKDLQGETKPKDSKIKKHSSRECDLKEDSDEKLTKRREIRRQRQRSKRGDKENEERPLFVGFYKSKSDNVKFPGRESLFKRMNTSNPK